MKEKRRSEEDIPLDRRGLNLNRTQKVFMNLIYFAYKHGLISAPTTAKLMRLMLRKKDGL